MIDPLSPIGLALTASDLGIKLSKAIIQFKRDYSGAAVHIKDLVDHVSLTEGALEALQASLRQAGSPGVAQILSQTKPTWSSQIPHATKRTVKTIQKINGILEAFDADRLQRKDKISWAGWKTKEVNSLMTELDTGRAELGFFMQMGALFHAEAEKAVQAEMAREKAKVDQEILKDQVELSRQMFLAQQRRAEHMARLAALAEQRGFTGNVQVAMLANVDQDLSGLGSPGLQGVKAQGNASPARPANAVADTGPSGNFQAEEPVASAPPNGIATSSTDHESGRSVEEHNGRVASSSKPTPPKINGAQTPTEQSKDGKSQVTPGTNAVDVDALEDIRYLFAEQTNLVDCEDTGTTPPPLDRDRELESLSGDAKHADKSPALVDPPQVRSRPQSKPERKATVESDEESPDDLPLAKRNPSNTGKAKVARADSVPEHSPRRKPSPDAGPSRAHDPKKTTRRASTEKVELKDDIRGYYYPRSHAPPNPPREYYSIPYPQPPSVRDDLAVEDPHGVVDLQYPLDITQVNLDEAPLRILEGWILHRIGPVSKDKKVSWRKATRIDMLLPFEELTEFIRAYHNREYRIWDDIARLSKYQQHHIARLIEERKLVHGDDDFEIGPVSIDREPKDCSKFDIKSIRVILQRRPRIGALGLLEPRSRPGGPDASATVTQPTPGPLPNEPLSKSGNEADDPFDPSRTLPRAKTIIEPSGHVKMAPRSLPIRPQPMTRPPMEIYDYRPTQYQRAPLSPPRSETGDSELYRESSLRRAARGKFGSAGSAPVEPLPLQRSRKDRAKSRKHGEPALTRDGDVVYVNYDKSSGRDRHVRPKKDRTQGKVYEMDEVPEEWTQEVLEDSRRQDRGRQHPNDPKSKALINDRDLEAEIQELEREKAMVKMERRAERRYFDAYYGMDRHYNIPAGYFNTNDPRYYPAPYGDPRTMPQSYTYQRITDEIPYYEGDPELERRHRGVSNDTVRPVTRDVVISQRRSIDTMDLGKEKQPESRGRSRSRSESRPRTPAEDPMESMLKTMYGGPAKPVDLTSLFAQEDVKRINQEDDEPA